MLPNVVRVMFDSERNWMVVVYQTSRRVFRQLTELFSERLAPPIGDRIKITAVPITDGGLRQFS